MSRDDTVVYIALGAAFGLLLGIVIALATDLPLAPEVGLVAGGVIAWLSLRERQ